MPREIQLIFDVIFIAIVLCAIYNAPKLARFERKVWFYTKAFFKSLYYTIKDMEETNNG